MRRGILRIVAGSTLVLLQILAIVGQASTNALSKQSLAVQIGFFSPAIIGMSLLVAGANTYAKATYSKLVLHKNTRCLHTITKWVGFALSLWLCGAHLLYLAWSGSFSFFHILILLGGFSFSIYALFYMYEKPSCLFSATLIFNGTAYICSSMSSLMDYLRYHNVVDDYGGLLLFAGIIPKLLAGVLYVLIATVLYTEKFPADVVKTLGWSAFALDAFNAIVSYFIVSQENLSGNWYYISSLLFAVLLMLYTSVFELNALQDVPVSGWQCQCGRIHANYVSSCVCGQSKPGKSAPAQEVIAKPAPVRTAPPAPTAVASQPVRTATPAKAPAQVRFCRKCGTKLAGDGNFCHICGTQIKRT